MLVKERGNSRLRLIDRYLGIPIIFLLGLFRIKRKQIPHFQSIALLKTSGIGDTVLLSGVIEDLKRQFPGKKITLFTGHLNFEMGKLISGCQVISLPVTKPWQAIRILRQHQFDLWMDFGPWPRINALLSYFARAKYRVGFKTAGQFRHYIYDKTISHSFKRHEIENYRDFVRMLGISKHSFPTIGCCKVQSVKKKRIALHLFPGGSRAYLKMWPDHKWEELIHYLGQHGYEVIFTGSGKDRNAIEKFLSGNSQQINLAGELTLQETAEYLTSCECVISVDTGIMHLAAALGCQVIALHGPTSPNRWGAVGKKVTAITPDIDYTPCIQLGFEAKCQANRCMQAIELKQVTNILRGLDEVFDSGGGERDEAMAMVSK